MTLDANEFLRRLLLHTLPDGFHRIRHYGLFANGHRAAKLLLCPTLIAEASSDDPPAPEEGGNDAQPQPAGQTVDCCPCCGGPMVRLVTLAPSALNRPGIAGELEAQESGGFLVSVQVFIEDILCFVRCLVTNGAVDAVAVVPGDPFQCLPFDLGGRFPGT